MAATPATTPPATRVATAPAWGLSFPLLAAAQLAWIPSAALLGLLFAAAVAPAYVLAMRTWQQVPAEAPALLEGLVLGLVAAGGYVTFALLFPILVAGARFALGVRSREGDDRITSPRMFAWYHQLLSTYAVSRLAGPFLRAVGLYKWFARGMGMKVGRGAILNSLNLYDMDLLEVGERAVVGGDAVLTGHVVEAGRLVRRRIRIEAGATIGLNAVILPGATIGRDAQVGAMSLVPKGARLEAGATYAGVPARRVK